MRHYCRCAWKDSTRLLACCAVMAYVYILYPTLLILADASAGGKRWEATSLTSRSLAARPPCLSSTVPCYAAKACWRARDASQRVRRVVLRDSIEKSVQTARALSMRASVAWRSSGRCLPATKLLHSSVRRSTRTVHDPLAC